MSLQFAIAFAEKYLSALKEAPPMFFSNLYLKLLLAKKDFAKAEAYLDKYRSTFMLWVEHGHWLLQIAKGKEDTEALIN